MRRVVVLFLVLGLALPALAAVNVTLSLPDDAPAVARRACAEANAGATPGACTAQEAAAWFAAQVDAVLLAEARNRHAKADADADAQSVKGARARFQAMTRAEQDAVCKFFGRAAGCTP